MYSLLDSSRSEESYNVPIITQGKTQNDYRCIPMLSKQLSAITGLDYGLYLAVFMKYFFLIKCLLGSRDLKKDQSTLRIPV